MLKEHFAMSRIYWLERLSTQTQAITEFTITNTIHTDTQTYFTTQILPLVLAAKHLRK